MSQPSQTQADYTHVDAVMSDIESKLDAALAKDESEASQWWGAQVWDWLTNAEYRNRRGQFEEDAAALVARAEKARDDCRRILNTRFAPTAHVPAELKANAADWRNRHVELEGIRDRMRKLSPIEGWTGSAATDYERAVEVQLAAMEELIQVMNSVGQGSDLSAYLHRMLFALARHALMQVRRLGDRELPGGGGFFYLRAANWGDYLILLPDVLNQIADTDNVEDALRALSQQLGRVVTLAEVLDDGSWPSGLDAAGVEPGPIGGNISTVLSEVDFEIPDSRTPGVCTQGAYRG